MKTIILSLISAYANAAEHFVSGYPTLWITHVSDASACDDMNEKVYTFRGITDLYAFDQKTCTCQFDFDKLDGKITGHFFKDSVPSPLSPGESYLQCQIDEIANHGLGDDCKGRVNELPYDYRTTMDLYFGYDHEHGEPNTGHFDEHGHFGKIEDCEGRVIHYAEEGTVLDALPEEKKSYKLTAQEKKELFIIPHLASRQYEAPEKPVIPKEEPVSKVSLVLVKQEPEPEPKPEPVKEVVKEIVIEKPKYFAPQWPDLGEESEPENYRSTVKRDFSSWRDNSAPYKSTSAARKKPTKKIGVFDNFMSVS